MKMIKKANCKFENGFVVCGDEVIGISHEVAKQIELLEEMVQKANFLEGQPAAQEAPSLDGFVKQSALKKNRPHVEKPATPVTDKRTKEALAFIGECDAVEQADKVNAAIDQFGELIDWVSADKFVEGIHFQPIDTFAIGDILKLDAKKIVELLEKAISTKVA